MPSRPEDDQSGSDYRWLYGGSNSPDPRGSGPSRDPEPAQKFPVQPRPPADSGGSAGGSSGSDVPHTRPVQHPIAPEPRDDDGWSSGSTGHSAGPWANRSRGSGGSGSGSGGGSRWGGGRDKGPRQRRPGRGKRIRRTILALLALWVVFLIVVPIMAWGKINKVDITPAGKRPAEQPGTTYLLVGSDSRRGLSPAEKKRLGAGGVAESGPRTDTIMLLHVGSGPNLLLSLPRDSRVSIPGHGTSKINSAFASGGPKLLVRTIEQNTGLRIDDYIEVGFGGFVNTVDAVGGVEMCPKRALRDRRSNLNVKAGCQTFDGVTSLAYSRNRHSFKALGDVQRATNQREIMGAIGKKVKSPWTVLNPFRYYNLNNAAASSLTINQGASPFAMGRFAWAMASGARTCTIPIADLSVRWDRPRALQLLKLMKEDRLDELPANSKLCTPSGLAR